MDLAALFPPETLPGRILDLLRDQGTEAYLVGGSVRDALLGCPVADLHDLDFAVPSGGLALARRLADALGGAFFALDAERDTGRVVLGQRLYVDIARWRGHSLRADLADRDFTINAIALDVARPEAAPIDPFRGQDDLAAGVVRVVSDSAFADDPARLLRAVRMEAQFGFRIAPHTEALLRAAAPRLSEVSRERVRDELMRILRPPGAVAHVTRLDDLGLLAAVVPELAERGWSRRTLRALEGLYAFFWPGAGYEPLSGEVAAMAELVSPWRCELRQFLEQPTSGDRRRASLLKLAALFSGAEGEMTGSALRRLRFSRQEVQRAQAAVVYGRQPRQLAHAGPVTRLEIYRFFRQAGDAGVEAVLLGLVDTFATPDAASHLPDWPVLSAAVAALLGGYFDRYREVVDPQRLIGGRDLMAAFDLPPGPRIGELLEQVREAQATGRVSSCQEALALARQLLG